MEYRNLLVLLVWATALPAPHWHAESSPPPRPQTRALVVMNGRELSRSCGARYETVLEACRSLARSAGGRLFLADDAYTEHHEGELTVSSPASRKATEKARWLRRRVAEELAPDGTVILCGDEAMLPTWRVALGDAEVTTDSLYSDLDADGIPDTAVARIVGSPETMLRQLRGRKPRGQRAVVLCSEDTRIHLETRAFSQTLSRMGYEVAIRGKRDLDTLAASDIIVHFGHGSPESISNRFGQSFVDASNMPRLSNSPIVFVDGCGTLPIGSPLLRAFLENGATGYVGATTTVYGMTPGRFTNELVEHFLAALEREPGATVPRLLTAARAAYVRGHPALAEKLRAIAEHGQLDASGDQRTDLSTVLQWVYYGDPQARLPRAGPERKPARRATTLERAVRLAENEEWTADFTTRKREGRAVLALHATLPLADRFRFRISVHCDGERISDLDGHRDTVYQRLGHDCRGGHIEGESYLARFLVPLPEGIGRRSVRVRLDRGTWVRLTEGTAIDVWPPDFAERIGLVTTPGSDGGKILEGVVRAVPTGVGRYLALDLSSVCNRSHSSVQVGGGDNASFRTWFSRQRIETSGVPFRVRRTGNDVLVSEDNTQNRFLLRGLRHRARALHVLLWGYNRPETPARLEILFADDTVQEVEVPLREWTEGAEPVAFDFQNTVRHFEHAAVSKETIRVRHPTKRIVGLRSLSGTYGLVAITVEAPERANR